MRRQCLNVVAAETMLLSLALCCVSCCKREGMSPFKLGINSGMSPGFVRPEKLFARRAVTSSKAPFTEQTESRKAGQPACSVD